MAMTPQELFVFLNNHKLTNPMEDEWASIKECVKTWLDGIGYPGQTLTVVFDDKDTYGVDIQRDNDIIVTLLVRNSHYNLFIKTTEGNRELSDHFHINFTY